MSAGLDELGRRRARASAAAAGIAGGSVGHRRLAPPRAGTLRPSPRRRLHAGEPVRVRTAPRFAPRPGSVFILFLQLAALAALVTLPTFTPSTIAVEGADLLPVDAIVDAAAVPSASIFTLDGEAVRDRVQHVALVQSVRVTTVLPATVQISITESRPLLRLVRAGTTELVADDGAAVDVGSVRAGVAADLPVLLDQRSTAATATPGRLDPNLAQLLASTATHFPAVFGCSVAAFQWDADGMVSIWTDRGWRAVLGHLDSAQQVSAVPGQLAALAALDGQLRFTAPQFGYVNLEYTGSPAVGGTPGLPPEVVAAARPR